MTVFGIGNTLRLVRWLHVPIIMVLVLGALASLATPRSAGANDISVPADYTFVETITVPVDGSTVASTTTLVDGVPYKLQASGTFYIGGFGDQLADAEYHDFTSPLDTVCMSADDNLGLGVDEPIGGSRSASWGSFNPTHTYTRDYTGRGAPISLNYHDCNYSDNSGLLIVDIFRLTNLDSTRTITSDSYTMVKYIRTFALGTCMKNLAASKMVGAVDVCVMMKNSANPVPPSSFEQEGTLESFINSKEYRGYIHIPAYSVTCIGGIVTSIVPIQYDDFSWSLGYTKLHLKGTNRNKFNLAERYKADSRVNGSGVEFTRATDGTYVDVSFASASRMGAEERYGNGLLTGYDAPFIWMNFRERISCDGSQVATVAYNAFPTTNFYVDGNEVSSDPQGTDFAGFFEQGDRIPSAEGYGNLAQPCHTRTYPSDSAAPWDPTTLCMTPSGGGFGGFGGGSSGGGGASGTW